MDIISVPIVVNKEWIDSRFRMVVLATERAKQIMSGAKPVIPTKYIKAATIALHEISECRVDYVIGKEARKAMQAAAAAKLLKAAEGAGEGTEEDEIKKEIEKDLGIYVHEPGENIPGSESREE